MTVGNEWENQVHQQLSQHPLITIERVGQTIFGPLMRQAIKNKPTPLRWLPDFIIQAGDCTIWLDAKRSEHHQTGNHSVENTSSDVMQSISQETRSIGMYAFWHEANQIGYVTINTWMAYKQTRSWKGEGSGTPFSVLSHDYCRPTMTQALQLRFAAA